MGTCSSLMVVDWQLFLALISIVQSGRGNARYLFERFQWIKKEVYLSVHARVCTSGNDQRNGVWTVPDMQLGISRGGKMQPYNLQFESRPDLSRNSFNLLPEH